MVPSFVSTIWQNLSRLLHISHITTTAFRPQSNGMIERFHRRLKATLRARCASPDWVAHLPWLLLSYRSSPHELTNISPAEAVYGVPLVIPAQFPISPDDVSSQFLLKLNNTLSGQLSFTPSPPRPAQDIPPDLL
jgi:transposase InsO family protein